MTHGNSGPRINYGIFGSGAMEQEHISYLHMVDGVSVTGIADTTEDLCNKAAQVIGNNFTFFATAEEFLSADLVDDYVLASRNHSYFSDAPKLLPQANQY